MDPTSRLDRIQEGSKSTKLSDGNARSFNDFDGCSVRLRHPLRNEKRIALLRAERQMTAAAMHLIGDNKGGLPE